MFDEEQVMQCSTGGKAVSGLMVRIQRVRRERFGDEGVARMAEALQIPITTWKAIERDGGLSGNLFLRFIDVTGACPIWLLTGEGEPFKRRVPEARTPKPMGLRA
jgi:hypothetical protein